MLKQRYHRMLIDFSWGFDLWWLIILPARQAAAYYFHGQILDEGLRRRSFGDSAAAQRAAEEFLNESIRACETFNSTPPLSR